MISGRRDRLFIRDHGESLKRSERKLERRVQVLDERTNRFMMLGLCGHLVTAGDFLDGQAVMRFVVLVDEFVQQPFT